MEMIVSAQPWVAGILSEIAQNVKLFRCTSRACVNHICVHIFEKLNKNIWNRDVIGLFKFCISSSLQQRGIILRGQNIAWFRDKQLRDFISMHRRALFNYKFIFLTHEFSVDCYYRQTNERAIEKEREREREREREKGRGRSVAFYIL